MKIKLSLPARLRAEAEAAADALGLSRSGLIRTALVEYLKERRGQELDRYITKYGAGLNEGDAPGLAHDHERLRRRAASPKKGRRTASRRMTISWPDALFEEAKATAKDLKLSHGKLVQVALEAFLRTRREKAVADSIDRYIAKHGSELSEEDKAWLAHNREQLRRVEWDE